MFWQWVFCFWEPADCHTCLKSFHIRSDA